MKRPNTVAVVAGALSMSFSGSAEALTPRAEQCAPVYEEITGQQPSGLQKIIEDFKSKGVDVQAQVYANAPEPEIDTADELRDFQRSLATACGFGDKNYINVTVINNPRLFNTITQGKAETDIPQATLRSKRGAFIEDLRDSETPYIEDITAHLGRLYPYKIPTRPPAPKPTQPNPEPGPEIPTPTEVLPKNEKRPDIPWTILLYAIGGLAAAGAGIARVRVGLKNKEVFKYYDLTSSRLRQDLVAITLEAKQAIETLPANDAKDLRNSIARSEDAFVELDDVSRTLTRVYRKQSRKIIPSGVALDHVVSMTKGTIKESETSMTETKRLFDEHQDQRKTLHKHLVDFKQLIGHCSSDIDRLRKDGWTTEAFETTLKSFEESMDRASGLIDRNYVDEPYDLISQKNKELEEFRAGVLTIAATLVRNDEKTSALTLEENRISDAISKALSDFRTAEKKYDTSCLSDISTGATSLPENLAELRALQQELLKLQGVKDYKAVSEASALIDKIADKQAELESVVYSTVSRLEHLATLEVQIPKYISQLSDELESTNNFITVNSADIDPELSQHFERLAEKLMLIKDMSAENRPKYLDIESDIDELTKLSYDLEDTARRQKEETIQMRQHVADLANKINRNSRDLQEYVQSNSSYVRSSFDIRGVDGVNTDAGRSDIILQIATLQALASDIDNARHQAESEVSAALAEIQRQEAEARRQRDADNYHSSSSNDYGSSGGSWGGGGSDGGSFGGGGSDGGSF